MKTSVVLAREMGYFLGCFAFAMILTAWDYQGRYYNPVSEPPSDEVTHVTGVIYIELFLPMRLIGLMTMRAVQMVRNPNALCLTLMLVAGWMFAHNVGDSL